MFKIRLSGFTLVELSIVLVIISLVIGGILVGQDMIAAAGIRAQISQIEKYNAAVNTFRVKYGYLPGDIPDPTASGFGFIARTGAGGGDGSGVLEVFNGVSVVGYSIGGGETGVFWNDLSVAQLIGANLTAAQSYGLGFLITAQSTPNIDNYLPHAKVGNGNYLYIFSNNNTNYYGLSQVSALSGGSGINTSPGLSEQQAYNIDQKMDDGYPQTGRVVAQYCYLGSCTVWAGGANGRSGTADTTATSPSATTCYDNGNVGGAVQHYSTEVSGGTGINCALSFRFQ